MYFLTIAAVIITFFILMFLTGGGLSVAWFIDMPSLILTLIICIPILMAAGALKDLGCGIKLAITKKEPAGIAEVKRAIQAVKLTVSSLWYGSLFISAISVILILSGVSETEIMWKSMAVIAIGLVYAWGMIILLLPIRTKLEFKLIEMIHQEEQE